MQELQQQPQLQKEDESHTTQKGEQQQQDSFENEDPSKAWMKYFVRPDLESNPHVRFLTKEELIQKRLEHRLAEEDKRKRFKALPDEEQEMVRAGIKEFVANLLNDIIDVVTQSCDPALRPPVQTKTKSSSSKSATSGSHLLTDLFSVEHFIASKSVPSSGGLEARVSQIRVLKQKGNPSCGYYGIHYALAVANTLREKSCVSEFFDRPLFWQRYWDAVRSLKARCDPENDSFPWSFGEIDGGVMEREYMNHLCAEMNASREYKKLSMKFIPMPECMSLLKGGGTYAQIKALNKVLKEFADGQNGCLVFFLGLVTHWVTFVAHRSKGRLEFLLFDSLNNVLLDGSEEAMWKEVQDKVHEKVCRGLKFPPFEQLLYFQQMMDIRESVNLLVEVMTTGSDLSVQWMQAGTCTILASFERFFQIDLASVKASSQTRCVMHEELLRGLLQEQSGRGNDSSMSIKLLNDSSVSWPSQNSAPSRVLNPSSSSKSVEAWLSNEEDKQSNSHACLECLFSPSDLAAWIRGGHHPRQMEELTAERYAEAVRSRVRDLLDEQTYLKLSRWLVLMREVQGSMVYVSACEEFAVLRRFAMAINGISAYLQRH